MRDLPPHIRIPRHDPFADWPSTRQSQNGFCGATHKNAYGAGNPAAGPPGAWRRWLAATGYLLHIEPETTDA